MCVTVGLVVVLDERTLRRGCIGENTIGSITDDCGSTNGFGLEHN